MLRFLDGFDVSKLYFHRLPAKVAEVSGSHVWKKSVCCGGTWKEKNILQFKISKGEWLIYKKIVLQWNVTLESLNARPKSFTAFSDSDVTENCPLLLLHHCSVVKTWTTAVKKRRAVLCVFPVEIYSAHVEKSDHLDQYNFLIVLNEWMFWPLKGQKVKVSQLTCSVVCSVQTKIQKTTYYIFKQRTAAYPHIAGAGTR